MDIFAIRSLIMLIEAYWTQERIELWKEYQKTNQSIPWKEFEHNKNVQSTGYSKK